MRADPYNLPPPIFDHPEHDALVRIRRIVDLLIKKWKEQNCCVTAHCYRYNAVRGHRGEVFADMWQGMTQGSSGRRNRHIFWMDFDDCIRNGSVEAWKAKDPWTVQNRRKAQVQRLQERLWGWAAGLLRRDRAEVRLGIRALLKRAGGWCGAKRGFGKWERQMREGKTLRAAGWKWWEPREGGFFAIEDQEAGYVRDKYC